jgi:hypothetical protein
MKANAHLQAINDETLQAIVQKLDELQSLMEPFATPLTPTERMTLPKMGEKTLAFVEKCFEFAQSNPKLCPHYLDMGEFETDYRDAHGLYSAVNKARQLLDNLADTQMCAGSEAFQAALLFYHSAKVAANGDIPGAKAVYGELRKRFPSPRRRDRSADTAADTEL